MNLFKLSIKYLKSRPLNTLLNTILFGLGISIIVILLLFSTQLEEKITDNSRGIDLVVGAKGSPLQIILCNIFHIDFPTGNIPLQEAEDLTRHRQVKHAIPLALGDSYNGYRIVGTNHDYAAHYSAEIEEGRFFERPMEATLGANVARDAGLKIGDMFESQHGLSEGGHAHDAIKFEVVGIMKAGYNVLDNLILTKVRSVWLVHETHDEDHHIPEYPEIEGNQLVGDADLQGADSTQEITSMLIKFRSPMAAIQLPRMVNQNTSMQAAAPAFETARLFALIGTGAEVGTWFAYIIIFIAALSIFIALYNSIKERKYDLAIMRSLGAGPRLLFLSIILEGLLLTLGGCLVGYLVGHITVEAIAIALPEAARSGITGLVWIDKEWYILPAGIILGIVASVLPAITVFKTDISNTLSKG